MAPLEHGILVHLRYKINIISLWVEEYMQLVDFSKSVFKTWWTTCGWSAFYAQQAHIWAVCNTHCALYHCVNTQVHTFT